MQPGAGNRLVNVNGGLFVYKFMSRQQVTKPSVCGVTCLLHVTAAKTANLLVNKSVVIRLLSREVVRKVDIDRAIFFKNDEGDLVDLTRTPEKKRKADQLDTDTSPSPKKNLFLWPLSSRGSMNVLDTKAKRLTEWSAFAKFGAVCAK